MLGPRGILPPIGKPKITTGNTPKAEPSQSSNDPFLTPSQATSLIAPPSFPFPTTPSSVLVPTPTTPSFVLVPTPTTPSFVFAPTPTTKVEIVTKTKPDENLSAKSTVTPNGALTVTSIINTDATNDATQNGVGHDTFINTAAIIFGIMVGVAIFGGFITFLIRKTSKKKRQSIQGYIPPIPSINDNNTSDVRSHEELFGGILDDNCPRPQYLPPQQPPQRFPPQQPPQHLPPEQPSQCPPPQHPLPRYPPPQRFQPQRQRSLQGSPPVLYRRTSLGTDSNYQKYSQLRSPTLDNNMTAYNNNNNNMANNNRALLLRSYAPQTDKPPPEITE